jgi:hypothetical protein
MPERGQHPSRDPEQTCRRVPGEAAALNAARLWQAAATGEFRNIGAGVSSTPYGPMVFLGWMLGMANGPMRAYTSLGTP